MFGLLSISAVVVVCYFVSRMSGLFLLSSGGSCCRAVSAGISAGPFISSDRPGLCEVLTVVG